MTRADRMLVLQVAFLVLTALALGFAVVDWAMDGVPSTGMLLLALVTLAHAQIEGLRRQLAQQERE